MLLRQCVARFVPSGKERWQRSRQREFDSLRGPPSIPPRRLDCSRHFLGEFLNLRKTFGEKSSEFAIGFKQRLLTIPTDEVSAVHSFALECRAHPVVHRSWYQAD